MSVHDRVEEWLRKMGYNEKIPSGFSKICNPSTAFIWEQLIKNVKPRPENRHKKLCIIANRLSEKPLNQQIEFNYPIKEIEVMMEKQKLDDRIKFLETTIEEKEKTINDLLQKNKQTYLTIDGIKAKIREKQDKKFLLQKKSKLIQEEIYNATEALTMARNLTPVEMEASSNGDEITKTLEECAEKLKQISQELTFPKTNNKTGCVSSCILKTTQTPKTTSFSNYLNQSSVLNSIAPSARKLIFSNKENIDENICRSSKFTDSMRSLKSEKKNRESLGLLPESCFNLSDELDAFLLDITKSENSILQSSTDSISQSKNIAKLSSDKDVEEILKNLLYNNNRSLILNQFGNICQKLFTEIKLSISKCNKVMSAEKNVNYTDLSDLYFLHVKNELLKEKSQIQLKKLQEIVKKKKGEILFQLSTRSRNKDEILKIFDLQIEENYITAANNFLRKEINSSNNNLNDNELQIMTAKINRVKEQIMEKSGSIESLINSIYAVLENIQNSCEETAIFVKRLETYIKDFGWASLMTERVNSQEVEVSRSFPIEFNRKLFRRSDVFVRDFSDTTIPSYLKLNSGDLDLISCFVDSVFSPPEIVILDILRTKFVLNKLSTVQSQSFTNIDIRNYSIEELFKREEYAECVINQLNSIINSNSVKQILSAPTDMEEVLNLWVEMPFRNYISDKRQVEGFGYKYYENKLQELKSHQTK